jgi:hypothetical protein
MNPKLKRAYELLEKHEVEIIEPLFKVQGTPLMKKFNNKVPNPGSDEAIAMGCICPSVDNCHGKGYLVPGSGAFCVSGACPIHGGETNEDEAKTEER